jgi:choline-glycine betaine transporter
LAYTGPLYRLIAGRSARNAFSIVVGFGLLFFMIEEWAFFILAGILLPYLLCRAGRPFLVSAICSFILLLIVHGYRFV